MTNKEIKKNYRKSKKANKMEYIKNKQLIKSKYQNDIVAYYEENGVEQVKNPPYRSVINEVGNAVSHGIGALFAILALILMLIKANGILEIIGAIIYGVGMFILFSMSSLYHSFKYGSKVKRIFRRFDYSSIYILIGATYTPILLNYIGGTFGIVYCVLQWVIIITGVTFIGVFGPGRIKVLHYTLYILLGWCGIILIPDMIKNNIPLLVYILGGGVAYSLGIIPFAINKKSSHFIWHLFVDAGAVIQWIGIYLYIYCK